MASDDTKLLVTIEARLTQFERAMAKATAGANRAAGQIESRFRGMDRTLSGIGSNLFGRFLVPAAAIASFTRLASAVQETVHTAAQLVDLADKIGITTDALQELRFQSDQQGSSAEALDSALEQFSKRIGEAAAGSGNLLDILKANGIALRDNAGNLRPLTELLASYADLIKNAANDQDRAVLATQAFGRAGDEMASVLRGGSAEMDTFRTKAHDLNQVVGEDGVRALEAFDDRLAELSGRWNTFWTEATVAALGALEQIGRAEHFILDPIIAALEDIRKGSAEDRARSAGAEAGRRIAGTQTPTPGIPQITIHPKPLTQTTRIPNLGGGSRTSATSDIERQKKSVADLVAELQRELSLIGATAVQQRISNELRRAGAVATDEQKARIAALVEQISAEETAHQQLIDSLDAVRDAAGGALDSFVESIQNGEGAAAGLKAALADILDSIIRIGEQKAIASLFGAAGGPGGGLLGGLLGSLFGGGRASGGPVMPGRVYRVGERGPEFFSPGMPGRIIPAGGGGGTQRVENFVHIEPSPLFITTVRQETRQAENSAVSRAPAVARDNQRRFAVP